MTCFAAPFSLRELLHSLLNLVVVAISTVPRGLIILVRVPS